MRGVRRGNILAKKSISLASKPSTIRFLFLVIFLINLRTIFSGEEQTNDNKEFSFSLSFYCERKISVLAKPGQTIATYLFLFSRIKLSVKLFSADLEAEYAPVPHTVHSAAELEILIIAL